MKPADGFTFEVYGDFNALPGDTDTYTLQAMGAWHGDDARLGVLYARRWMETGPDTKMDLDILSVYGVVDVSDNVSLLGRFDHMFDPNPKADGISYLPMSPDGQSNLVLAGVDFAVSENLSIIPNVEAVFYDAVGAADAPDTDVVPRLTISLTF